MRLCITARNQGQIQTTQARTRKTQMLRLVRITSTRTGSYKLTFESTGVVWDEVLPCSDADLRKVRWLADHPWVIDSDKTGKTRSARRKGAHENSILTGRPFHTHQIWCGRGNKTSALLEAKPLRDGFFVHIPSSQIHSSQFRP